VIENAGGSIVSFNYDGVDRQQRRFPVIHPHGQRPESLVDPVVGPLSRKLALAHGYAPSVNWHLPVPENSAIQTHGDYRAMVRAWRAAAAIVLVGYRFGWGMDGYSFADFGGVLRADTRVHVLCPKPDNADLRKQVREALKHRGIHVFGQPFSWRNFAESALRLLREHRDRHVSYLIGHEPAFLRQHDHELPPLEAPKSSGTPPTIRDEVLLNVRSDHFTAFGEHRAFPLDELCFE
jgi:hypothetical protein